MQHLINDNMHHSSMQQDARRARWLQSAPMHLETGLDGLFVFVSAVLIFMMQAGFAMVRTPTKVDGVDVGLGLGMLLQCVC